MKPYLSIIVFTLLMLSSIVTGTGSYMETKGQIASDLNRALAHVLAEKGKEWVTADTIRVCRQLQATSATAVSLLLHDEYFNKSLSIPELRGKSYISMAVVPNAGTADIAWQNVSGISGDTVVINPGEAQTANVSIALRGNAECSFATVFSLSDQKIPATLWLAAMIWGAFSIVYIRRHNATGITSAQMQTIGNICFDSKLKAFYNHENKEIRFTPMQATLMEMFFNAEGHKLTKSEICSALWPGKDDANETLYTLIRRLKLVVEQDTCLRIESERGRAYILKTDDC